MGRLPDVKCFAVVEFATGQPEVASGPSAALTDEILPGSTSFPLVYTFADKPLLQALLRYGRPREFSFVAREQFFAIEDKTFQLEGMEDSAFSR